MSAKRGTVRAIVNPEVTLDGARQALSIEQPASRSRAETLLGLCVNYRPRDARNASAIEPGVITGVRGQFVLVRYWGNHESKATTPECLTWAYPR